MTEVPSGIPRVCAIVVTYRPPTKVLYNLELLAPQVEEIVVVDDGSGEDYESTLRTVATLPKVRLLRNPENRGIAAGLNAGIRRAIADGFEWIATFDQDSTVGSAFIQEVFNGLMRATQTRVGIISPYHVDPKGPKKRSSDNASPIRVAMTSGSVIRASVFKTVGFYDESLFIDYVDYDFCLRTWLAGYEVVRVDRAHLIHRLGTTETRSLPGFKIRIKTHSPLRRYYIMRNRVILYRRYFRHFPGWCMRDLLWLLLELSKILLLETQRRAKLKNAFLGIGDGLRGRTGKKEF